MPDNYRYQLDKSSKKYICPKCNKKSFVRYIDTDTKQYLPEQYGRCDRESNCAYHLTPYADGYGTNEAKQYEYKPKPKPQPQPLYFMPESVLNATLKDYDKNVFIQNLLTLVPVEDIQKVIELYRLGTIGKGERLGACTFPFIDKAGNIRTIQAKQFNETNHTSSTDFVHSILYRHFLKQGEPLPGWLNDYSKNDLKVSCLFGEHLLNKYPCNPVALVEAPKTAIIGALYYGLPETPGGLLWIAVYNKSSLTVDKCKALQGRKVVLFPDLNAYELWNAKAQELKVKVPGTRFVVSDLLEKNATETERINGLDLADYLTRFDYKLFRKEQAPSPAPEPMAKSEKSEKSENETKHFFEQISKPEENIKDLFYRESNKSLDNTPAENWSSEIKILEAFFNESQLLETPIQLTKCETITDVSKFIQSHITAALAYNGNTTFKPYLIRLYKLKEFITLN